MKAHVICSDINEILNLIIKGNGKKVKTGKLNCIDLKFNTLRKHYKAELRTLY